ASIEVTLRLRRGRARSQAPDDAQKTQSGVAAPGILLRQPRRDQLGIADLEWKVGPEHADDRERLAVEPDPPANHVARGAEPALATAGAASGRPSDGDSTRPTAASAPSTWK